MQYFAEQTGGEIAKASRPEDFASAVDQIINNLSARYVLGFALDEREQNDGRFHRLEVKVNARDAKDKERKLVLSARQGYYSNF